MQILFIVVNTCCVFHFP